MVKIAVQWARGLIKLEMPLSAKVSQLIEKVSQETTVPANTITILAPEPKTISKFTKQLDPNSTLANSKIKSGTLLYMQTTEKNLPDVKFGQSVLPVDVHAHFIEEDQKNVPKQMIQKAKELGARVVTPALFEYREKTKPHFTYQKESSCFAIRIGLEAINRFQKIAFSSNFATHRLIFLFGRINEITGKITVHCGMEPPQKNFADHVEIDPNFNMDIPLQIAKAFGMNCIGMAISHNCASKNHPMTEYMVKLAAKYQNEFTEYFTTVTITPTSHNGVSSLEMQGFQVNDATMKVEKAGLFAQSEEPEFMAFNTDIKFQSKPHRKLDTNLALCAVRIRTAKSHFPSNAFPSPSAMPTTQDLKEYFNDNQYCPPWRQLFDFNLLVYLVQIKVLAPMLIDTVVNQIIYKKPIEKTVMANLKKYIQ